MMAATTPRLQRSAARLLHVDPKHGAVTHRAVMDLPELLAEGDLLIVNDAATLPASLRLPALDAELRLVAHGPTSDTFRAVLFGSGDYRTPTEHRPEPPLVAVGDVLVFGDDLQASVTAVESGAPRLIEIRFATSGAHLLSALYRLGRPIQYSHVREPLALWDVQNRFAGRPWAFELPSAGHPIDGELLLALRARGVRIETLTHAAGISSTGSPTLDRRLPLPERFEIPETTVEAVEAALAKRARILAVGTTVVRALESSAREHGSVRAGVAEARFVIGPGFQPRVTTGVLSGMHEPGTSHFALLQAFAPATLLERALDQAQELGYLEHEFGDSCLVLPST